MSMHLTKSRYLTGQHCSKKLWLSTHRYELGEYVKSFAATIGDEVGIGATTNYPNGKMIQASYKEHEAAVKETLELINDDETGAIFEAAFEYENIRIRVDIFERLGDNKWGIREVKSSKSVQDHFYNDIGIQYYVLVGLGYNIASAKLIHTNSNYILRGKEIDWGNFFSTVEYLPGIKESLPEIKKELLRLREIQHDTKEPFIYPSKGFCKGCEFWDYCTKEKPSDWVEHLPRLSPKKRNELQELKIENIAKIPEGYSLTNNQSKVVNATKTGKVFCDDSFSSEIKKYNPPAYYFDFETLSCAIPIFQGLKPFERVPFQWSLHHLSAEGKTQHWEFLAREKTDFRREMIESFINIVHPNQDKIIVYNASFEKSVLKEMGVLYPDLQDKIDNIIERIEDLMAFIQKNFYHPQFNGSFSLKKVLPALLPHEEQYSEGEVSGGDEAQAQFYNLICDKYDQNKKATVADDLIAYCNKDTHSLILIYQHLLKNY